MVVIVLANAAMVVIQTAKVALVGVGLAFGSLQVSLVGRVMVCSFAEVLCYFVGHSRIMR